MNNPDSKPSIGTCTLCLQEKPIIVPYKLVDVEYALACDFNIWIRKQLNMGAYSYVNICLDCFKAWVNDDTPYLNMYVLKQRLLR